MSDFIVKNENGLEILLESKQQAVRQDLIEQYVRCRKIKKLTQSDIADALGVTRPNITRFENGTYNPTVDMLVKIAECMGMELEIRLVEQDGKENN